MNRRSCTGDLVDRARRAVGDDPGPFGLERLSGGMSHAVFGPVDDATLVVKVFASSTRQEPEREWEALVAFGGSGVAPEAVHSDFGDPAVVVMTKVAGTSLPASSLGAEHARAIGEAHRRVHGAGPLTGRPLSHVWIREACAALHEESDPDAPEVFTRAWAAARRWVGGAGVDVDRILSAGGSCFSRGDPNLSNYLWSDGGLVLVDWESSGPSDPVVELADFAEHASTRELTEEFLAALAEATGLSAADRRRLADARRLVACFWLVLIASHQRAGLPTTVSLEDQAHRTLAALGEARR